LRTRRTRITQVCRKDTLYYLPQYGTLILSADLKAISASVANGCGFEGNEVPVGIFLDYLEADGTQKSLRFLFYFGGGSCGNPVQEANAIYVAVAVTQNQWSHFDSVNLRTLIPSAYRLIKITV